MANDDGLGFGSVVLEAIDRAEVEIPQAAGDHRIPAVNEEEIIRGIVDDEIELARLGVRFPVTAVYEDVVFPPEENDDEPA